MFFNGKDGNIFSFISIKLLNNTFINSKEVFLKTIKHNFNIGTISSINGYSYTFYQFEISDNQIGLS